MSGNASTTTSRRLARIAGASLPPRVQVLLERIHALAVEVLEQPLKLTMVGLDRDLFQRAEKARNSQVQSDIYAQMRQLRECSEQFPAHFFDALEQQLAEFQDVRHRAAAETTAASFKTMTLVEDTDIDRDIVLHEMARRESNRAVSPLQLLGQRFGVLAAQPAIEIERLPVGPYALCRALRDCGEQLQLSLETQLLLYQVFERQVMERHTELIDRANILLAREGVLPGLVYRPYLVRPSAPRGAGQSAPPPGPASTATGQRPAANRPLTGWQGQAPAASWAILPDAPNTDGVAAGTASAGTALDNPAPSASIPTVAASPAGDGGLSAPGMSALHSLLDAARHTQRHGPATGAGPGGLATAASAKPAASRTAPPAAVEVPQPVPSQAVMDVLGLLQTQAAAPGTRRSIGDIRAALLGQIKADHGPAATLAPQDADTLDLLGMLYTQIQREVRSEGPAADLLTQLQVPVARAAIHDEAFFVRDQHPARELLNAVAESGATWLGDDDSDPALLQKLGEAVNKVVSDYDGNEAVFAEANQQIQTHLRTAARKAEVTERRHVEAARGKERLEAAKQLATRTIDQQCRSGAAPKFVQTLLRQAWADVLTLTLLRQGENSEEWQQRQHATARINEITASPAGGAPDVTLGSQIEESLLQVGYHRDEAGAIARRLSTPGGEDDTTSKTELSAKLKARTRLGEGSEREDEEEQRRKPPPERTPEEESHYRQLRTMPFGTWFEFTVNQQGDVQRQRLSWYSLITDNALFVNQRGQKVAEHSLDALARLMAKGQLRLVTEDRARLIDRAWQATLRTLRSLAGGRSAAESA